MKCFKCEEGKLTKIKYKTSDKIAVLCEFCGTLWSENELINRSPGHAIESTMSNDKREYSFDDLEFDQESQDIIYAKYK